jgi:signal transduction histidine kinase
MKGRGHRKQIFLFLTAVLLPSFILIFLTIRMISQERELSQKRLMEEQQRTAQDIGQRLLVRLETIKLQEAQAVAKSPQSLTEANYANTEVVLIGLIKEGQLALPWEINQKTEEMRKFLNSTRFTQMISRAEREEFIRKNFGQAAEQYRQAVRTAEALVQKEFARLMLARVLVKANRKSEAKEHYLRILAQPPQIQDENGIPLFLYAAQGLLAGGTSYPEILDRLRSDLSANRWFSPTEAYMVNDVIEKAIQAIEETSIIDKAEDNRRIVQERIRNIEQALSFRQDFPSLLMNLSQESQNETKAPVWVSYGSNPWLLSLTTSMIDSDSLLVAVDQEKTLVSLRAEKSFADVFPQDFLLTKDVSADGEYLEPNFPGLKIVFTSPAEAFKSEQWSLRYYFYLLALFLILSVTLFGAYLLWRDVRRDVRMAELRSQFVSSVSHELKTPLTAIRMFAETLRLGRTKNAKTQDEYLETIVNESQRLTRLLNNVLDFSKIEEGKRTYRPERTSLNEIIQTAARAMEYPLSQQGFKLHIQVDEELLEVSVDRDAIEQAILNLLHNAMKYSGQSRDIDLRLLEKNGQALIQVIDRGIGIEPHEQERIFDKFYRIPSSENERLPGTGLGLSLVAHIAKAHGGHIDVKSTPGKGSTFSIYLPLEKET